MTYRGDDLDLRTPQTRHPTADALQDAGTAQHGQAAADADYSPLQSTPIWVDETVLQCCNYAYEVAQAHRAAEVCVEHVIYALTRIEPATEVLARYGVFVEPLRREIAAFIASEIPVGPDNDTFSPRRSDELEGVLRAAAQHAMRRDAPAGVEDVMHTLTQPGSRVTGMGFLHAYVTRTTRSGRDGSRERVRMPAGSSYMGDRAGGIRGATALASGFLVTRGEDAGGMLHGSVRGAAASEKRLASDARLDDLARSSADVSDRLAALERVVGNHIATMENVLRETREEVGRSDEEITARLAALDLTPIRNRLDIIEEAVLSGGQAPAADLLQRLDKLENQMKAGLQEASEARTKTGGDLTAILSALSDYSGRIGETKSMLLGLLEDHHVADEGRFAALETTLTGQAESFKDTSVTYLAELNETHEALLKLNANQHTIAGAIDQWRLDAAGDLGVMSNRLHEMELRTAKSLELAESLRGDLETMHRLTVERHHRRNRFWYWLFGTDDWLAASWPSQLARIEEERRAIRTPKS